MSFTRLIICLSLVSLAFSCFDVDENCCEMAKLDMCNLNAIKEACAKTCGICQCDERVRVKRGWKGWKRLENIGKDAIRKVGVPILVARGVAAVGGR